MCVVYLGRRWQQDEKKADWWMLWIALAIFSCESLDPIIYVDVTLTCTTYNDYCRPHVS